jgi:hypothetical protein
MRSFDLAASSAIKVLCSEALTTEIDALQPWHFMVFWAVDENGGRAMLC